MPKFEPTKRNLREAMLFCFHLKKSGAGCHRLLVDAYGNHTPTVQIVENWFRQFKSGDLDLENKECTGQPKKFADTKLKAFLDQDHHRRTLPNSADKIERYSKGNTSGMRGKA